MADAYRRDLAFIHDSGFGHIVKNAGPVVLSELRRCGLERGTAIDLGCGSGILAAQLADAGYDVLGFDISAAMIAIARRRAPRARFHCQSFVKVALAPCILVTAIGEIVNFQFDRGNTEEALPKVFRRVYDALCPGGLFVFDASGPGRVANAAAQRSFREGDGWAVLVEQDEDRQQRTLTRRITSFRRVGKHYRRDHEVHELRLLPAADVTSLLRRTGFRVRLLHRYGPLKLPPAYVGFVARK